MEVCRHSRDSKAAVEVFEAMETEGVRPGVRSYTSLLKVCSPAGVGMFLLLLVEAVVVLGVRLPLHRWLVLATYFSMCFSRDVKSLARYPFAVPLSQFTAGE